MSPSAGGAAFELGEDELGDGLQGFEDAFAGGGDRLEVGNASRVQHGAELGNRRHRGHVALVVLNHVGKRVEVVALLREVRAVCTFFLSPYLKKYNSDFYETFTKP